MKILEKHLSKLRGQTAWITGGKRVGQVVARALAEQGVNLIVSYRSSQKEADQIVKDAKKLGVKALAVRADVSSRESMERAARMAIKVFPKIHILVNMASVFGAVSFEKITQRDWDSNYGAHILGTFWPMQVLLPYFPRGAHIISIADRTSVGKAYKNYLPYIVTKAGVEALTRAAAKELAYKGIFVNAIAPGPIIMPEGESRTYWTRLRESSPLKYPMDDREAMDQFALLVLYLSVVTLTSGRTYLIDQGQNL